jgi:hypothetical protein
MPKYDVGELITALNEAVNKLNNLHTKYDDLEKERDALRAEKVNLQDDLVSAERERAHQHGRADRNAAEYAREQKKREQLQAENEKLRAVLQRIVENEDQFSMAWAAEIARAALGEKE